MGQKGGEGMGGVTYSTSLASACSANTWICMWFIYLLSHLPPPHPSLPHLGCQTDTSSLQDVSGGKCHSGGNQSFWRDA